MGQSQVTCLALCPSFRDLVFVGRKSLEVCLLLEDKIICVTCSHNAMHRTAQHALYDGGSNNDNRDDGGEEARTTAPVSGLDARDGFSKQ